ncbi:hypothetical protein [Ruegeria atlantica]|uniref:hypothetical protein n=1 Tax=Ruegeria atlantica TaxID=81569 RepID=UPI00147D83BA|nr:hypothetical protein [Ruegeria atlantica]
MDGTVHHLGVEPENTLDHRFFGTHRTAVVEKSASSATIHLPLYTSGSSLGKERASTMIRVLDALRVTASPKKAEL